MSYRWERLTIQIQLERLKQEEKERRGGARQRPPEEPRPGKQKHDGFWRLIAGLGCALVSRGYRLRRQYQARPGLVGNLMIGAGRKMRRRALTVVKSAPCN